MFEYQEVVLNKKNFQNLTFLFDKNKVVYRRAY